MCLLPTGTEFPLGSAADLLVAGRFANFTNPIDCQSSTDSSPGCQVISTSGQGPHGNDPHTQIFNPWVLADFTIELQQSASRTDIQRVVKGTAQIDLFFCADAACSRVADMQHISARNDATDVTLAVGYSRIDHTMAGIPLGFVDHTQTKAYAVERTDLKDLLPSGMAQPSSSLAIQQLVYQPGATVEWLDAAPTMWPVGEWSRAFHSGWSRLRVGTYKANNLPAGQDCITIVSPVHPWMDAQGWNTSHDCGESSSVYLLHSYLPQAFVMQSQNVSAWGSNEGQRQLWFGEGMNRPSEQLPYKFNELADVWRSTYSTEIQSFGRSLLCDGFSFSSDNTRAGCYYSHHPDSCGDECVVAVVGSAPLLLTNITEAKLMQLSTTNSGERKVTLDGGDYDNQGSGSNPVGPGVLSPRLLTLVRMSQDEHLPWCMGDSGYTKASRNPFGFAHVADASGKYQSLFNCSLWDSQGLGKVYPVAPLPGKPPAMFASILKPTWLNVSLGIGFVGQERPTPTSIDQAVFNIMVIAARQLDTQTAVQVSLVDATTTRQGAAMALALLVVSVLAVAVGRKDMEETLSRWITNACGRRVQLLSNTSGCSSTSQRVYWVMMLLLPRLLTMLISAVGIILPAAINVAAERAARGLNTFPSTVAWVSLPALGYGQYRVLASISYHFEPLYDSLGLVLTWANLGIAIIATLAIWVRSAVGFWHCWQKLNKPAGPVQVHAHQAQVKINVAP